MKSFVCDSGLFISYTNSCLYNIIKYLHEKGNINFLITDSIIYETIKRPLGMRNKIYMLSAVKIRYSLDKHYIQRIKLDEKTIEKCEEFLNITNNLFYVVGKPIKLVHRGEAEIIALANSINIPYILMDERTTRLLIEAPLLLKKHLEKEYRINVMMDKSNFDKLREFTKNMQVFRSTELLAVAYKLGYFDKYEKDKKDMFEAALYSLKYAGCSISYDEIERIMGMIS